MEPSPQLHTLPRLLIKRAEREGGEVAVRKKKLGIWHTWTWPQCLEEVKYACLGLVSLGLSKGDKVALIGDNDPELIFAELATQAFGGSSFAIFPDMPKEQVRDLLNISDSKVVIAGDQEQVDKLLAVKDHVPLLQKIIYVDPKGMRNYRHPYLQSYGQLRSTGKDFQEQHPRLPQELVDSGRNEDVALLCLTSGTTTVPKLAMLSHRNLIAAGSMWLQVDPYYGDYVSVLPLAWIGEQINIVLSLLGKIVYNFPEEPETSAIDLREIGPTRIGGPPRMWERIASDLMFKAKDSTWLKKKLYEWGMKLGHEITYLELEGKSIPLHYSLLRQFFYWILYRPILDKTGLKRVKVAYTGGGALGAEYFMFFRALGLNLKELYSLTESSCVTAFHRNDDIKIGTAGTPLPGVDVKISDKGEIMVRGENVFLGYYRNPEATAKTLMAGWLYTGDSGLIDEDGHLVIVDRLGDVATLADGTKFSPQYIENKLKFSPFIREAIVYGKDRPYLVAVLNVDYSSLSKWAEKRGIPFTDYADLSQRPEVYDLLQEAIREANQRLPSSTRIRRFTSLHKELDADDLELTRTRKLRRKFVYERYGQILDALYSDGTTLEATVAVTYRDGRQGSIRSTLQIRKVED